MSQRVAGLVLIGAGVLIAIIGVVGSVSGGSGPGEGSEAAATTSSTGLTSTTTTSSTTTSTTLPATTTTLAMTTTTIDAGVEIQEFVPRFAEAIESQDVDYLFDTLHPAVLALFEEDLCRTFIQDEILLLQNYRLTGSIEGPTSAVVAEMPVQIYEGPVAFLFQGESFTATASFALDDGVRWFAECR